MQRLLWVYGRHLNKTVDYLGQAFQNRGYELIHFSLQVPRLRKILPIIKTLELRGGRLRAYSSVHPDTFRHIKAPEEFSDVPAFVFGDGLILSSAPHYFYRDLDYRTVLEFRTAGMPTFMYDHFPLRLLETLAAHQDEVFSRARTIFTMSRWIRERMIQHGVPAERIEWVGAGANINPWPVENPYTDENLSRGRFLFVGRDFERKGGPLVLEAWKRVHRAAPHARLVVIGPQPGIDADGVEWLGPQPSEAIVEQLTRAMAFVMPSRWEAYGIAFLEALAFGVPSVGMNRMAMPEFIKPGQTGDLLSSESVHELAEIMLRLLQEPDRTWTMSRKAHQEAQMYRWDRVRERIEHRWSQDANG